MPTSVDSRRRRIKPKVMASALLVWLLPGRDFFDAVSAVVFAMCLFLPLSGTDAAYSILIVAVVAPICAFVILENIDACENGVCVPSTILALRICAALGCRVEQVFTLK